MGTTASASILSYLYHISNSTEFQLTLETWSIDQSTLPNSSTQPNSTHDRSKSQNWDKWVLPLQRLSWAIYSTYPSLLCSSLLSRLTALTRVLSQTRRPNQTVLTIDQCRETGTSGSYPSSDYPEQSIPDIDIYWVLADPRDLQLWSENLSKPGWLLDRECGKSRHFLSPGRIAKWSRLFSNF